MNKKGFNLIEFIEVIVIVAVLAAVLLPVFQKAMKAPAVQCQENMCTIGKAMKMYLSDWEDTYPTNRLYMPMTNPPRLTSIINNVPLSDPNGIDPSTGEPIRFQYGINWVEGLYPYIAFLDLDNSQSVWICPSTRNMDYTGPGGSNIQGIWPSVTYAFNRNLTEMPEGFIKRAGNLMMLRELDRRYNSTLRPLFESLTQAQIPNDPFLGPEDVVAVRKLKYNLHKEGSNILFADGHVQNFPAEYFANSAGQWDAESSQWYNWVNAPADTGMNKSIAISP